MNEDILITTKDFDHSKEILKLKGKGIGAIVSFTGVVIEIVGKFKFKDTLNIIQEWLRMKLKNNY